MANNSAKRIAADNKKTLRNLQLGFLIVNGVYILWRVVIYWKTFTLLALLAYGSTLGVSLYLFNVLRTSGTPKYASDGSLVSSGEDLNGEGLVAYMFDIIYITWFVHLTTAFISRYFWYVYLTIPAYAVYKLAPMAMNFLSGGGLGGGAGEEKGSDAPSKSKRQAKLEKRSEKGQAVKYKR